MREQDDQPASQIVMDIISHGISIDISYFHLFGIRNTYFKHLQSIAEYTAKHTIKHGARKT